MGGKFPTGSEDEATSKKINVTMYGKPTKVKGVKATPTKAKCILKVSWKKCLRYLDILSNILTIRI